MKRTSISGWFYLFFCTCFTAILILNQDLHAPMLHLLIYSLVIGYILAVLLYSSEGFFRHLFLWIFNIRNYRYYYRNSSRKRKMFKFRLIPDLSRR